MFSSFIKCVNRGNIITHMAKPRARQKMKDYQRICNSRLIFHVFTFVTLFRRLESKQCWFILFPVGQWPEASLFIDWRMSVTWWPVFFACFHSLCRRFKYKHRGSALEILCGFQAGGGGNALNHVWVPVLRDGLWKLWQIGEKVN